MAVRPLKALRRLLMSLVIVLACAAGGYAQSQPPRPAQQDEFVPVSDLPPQEQLPSAPLVVAAYAFAWLAIGGYVFSVAKRLTTVQREIERLEADTKRSR
jgi:CcmD family protein